MNRLRPAVFSELSAGALTVVFLALGSKIQFKTPSEQLLSVSLMGISWLLAFFYIVRIPLSKERQLRLKASLLLCALLWLGIGVGHLVAGDILESPINFWIKRYILFYQTAWWMGLACYSAFCAVHWRSPSPTVQFGLPFFWLFLWMGYRLFHGFPLTHYTLLLVCAGMFSGAVGFSKRIGERLLFFTMPFFSFLKKRSVALTVLILAGGLTRALFAYQLSVAPLDPEVLEGPDSATYDILASRIAAGKVSSRDPLFGRFVVRKGVETFETDPSLHQRTASSFSMRSPKGYEVNGITKPGYVLFLVGIYRLFGHQRTAARLVHVFLTMVSTYLIFRIGELLTNRAVAFLATALFVGSGFLICYGTYIGTETLGLCLLLLSLYCLIHVQQTVNREGNVAWGRLTLSGLSLGGCILTRPEFVLLPFVWAAVMIFTLPKERPRACLCFLSAIALSLLPWVLRNYFVYGQLLFLEHLQDPYVWQHNFRTASGGISPKEWLFRFSRGFFRFWGWKEFVTVPDFLYLLPRHLYAFLVAQFFYLFLIGGILLTVRQWRHFAIPLSLLCYKTLIESPLNVHVWKRFTVEPFVFLMQAYCLWHLVEPLFQNVKTSE